ncbi:unnamed protein product [Camellia sinensis]
MVEAESLRHLSAKYCPLLPPPRSTIAAAFSPDGKTLASTQEMLEGVEWSSEDTLGEVRFHPLYPEIIASGSLDHEVRLWDANTAECIGSHDFYRPIASIAFHAQGDLLAVASGHKLYIWHYNRRGDTSSPTIVLKTRRSLRVVHFHPYAAPFLLTAEVNGLDSSDSTMTPATSPGYLCYPPPTMYLADAHSGGRSNLANELPFVSLPFLIWPSIGRDDERITLQHTNRDVDSSSAAHRVDASASVQLLTYSTLSGQYELLLSPIEPSTSPVPEEHMENAGPQPAMDSMETAEVQPEERSNQFFPFGDPRYWELPFLQGWLIGQSQAGQRTLSSLNGGAHENSSSFRETQNSAAAVPSVIPLSVGHSRVTGRSSSRHRSAHSRIMSASGSSEGAISNNITRDESDHQPFVSRIQSDLATSSAAAATAELPCTVKLRIWAHDIKDPSSPLDAGRCRLTIPHAVLLRYGRSFFTLWKISSGLCCMMSLGFLIWNLILVYTARSTMMSLGFQHHQHDTLSQPIKSYLNFGSIPSRKQPSFGLVLASRAIRAAHCLTSIQCSLPRQSTCYLAYGRRHSSLLKSVVIDGETTIPIYTILEVYRVSDMELVRVLLSAEDEVNVACFRPSVGSGLVYGTKEGKLRILQYETSHSDNCTSSGVLDEHMLEVAILSPNICFRMLVTTNRRQYMTCTTKFGCGNSQVGIKEDIKMANALVRKSSWSIGMVDFGLAGVKEVL